VRTMCHDVFEKPPSELQEASRRHAETISVKVAKGFFTTITPRGYYLESGIQSQAISGHAFMLRGDSLLKRTPGCVRRS